jgi:hypothetical protein
MSYDCYCDYEAPSVCSVRHIKSARKPHVCYECRAPILAGEPYEYTSGIWDGEFSDFHTCKLCAELREWAKISVPCFCWAHGDLHENVREMVQDIAPTLPGFFMEYGRRMVKIRQCRAALTPVALTTPKRTED